MQSNFWRYDMKNTKTVPTMYCMFISWNYDFGGTMPQYLDAKKVIFKIGRGMISWESESFLISEN